MWKNPDITYNEKNGIKNSLVKKDDLLIDPLSIRAILPVSPVTPIGPSGWSNDSHNVRPALASPWDCHQDESCQTCFEIHLEQYQHMNSYNSYYYIYRKPPKKTIAGKIKFS